MMHWLWTILIGFVAGLIAKAIMGGGPSGFIMTALLGIAGSLVATVIGQVTGLYGQGSGAGLIMSVAGAALLLFLYHKFGNK